MTAQDYFEQYYAEKIWEMIPEVYRYEDGRAEAPNQLRAFVEVLASQAAVLRRSMDRTWEDQFIESASQTYIPYIGNLLGTRMISALNERGRRADVALTIYYRRRAGTLRVLEELISSITDWEGIVVEGFKRLARSRHGLDLEAGEFGISNCIGGTADLRHAPSLAGTPFDTYYYTPEFHRPRGREGRYHMQRLTFHLYRLRSLQLDDIQPFEVTVPSGTGFTFDPSGRDVHLFARRNRPELWDDWTSAEEWQLPVPISCRLLSHATYRITEADVLQLDSDFTLSSDAIDALRTMRGMHFKSESQLRNHIRKFTSSAEILAEAVYQQLLGLSAQDDNGKQALIPSSISVRLDGSFVPTEQITAANLENWDDNSFNKRVLIDPERGRVLINGTQPDDVLVSYRVGAVGTVGAGSYARTLATDDAPDILLTGGGEITATDLPNSGVTIIADSLTYSPIPNKLSVQTMKFYAEAMQRPYLYLQNNWVLNSGGNVDATLDLDGLWIGGDAGSAVILRGDYETVTLRSCTLDTGGIDANGNDITSIPLIVEGFIETLILERCVFNRISVAGDGLIESLIVRDSIGQTLDPTIATIDLARGTVTIERSTIHGFIDVLRLYASDCIFTGVSDVSDTQNGCFRFSAAPVGSRLPYPYEYYVLTGDEHLFTSRVFGASAYSQLIDTAPDAIRRGGENGGEMGAFNALIDPIKFDSLQAKVAEYTPFGMVPSFIFET